MNGWITFWGILLLATLAFYAVLVVYVSIGGLKDIKAMFKALSDDDADPPSGGDDR